MDIINAYNNNTFLRLIVLYIMDLLVCIIIVYVCVCVCKTKYDLVRYSRWRPSRKTNSIVVRRSKKG